MINFYNLTKQENQYKNPNYKIHGIELPFRMVIASGSGTGKTNSLMNLILLMDKTFNKIIICVKSAEEPLYQHLIANIPEGMIEVHEDGVIPPIDNDKKKSKLIIFDDLYLDKCQEKIKQYYIRGRKFGYSCIYISQSFHGIPYDTRKNSGYFILGRSLLDKDLKVILQSFTSNLDKDEFKKIYRAYTDKPLDVCFIDLENKTIRHNINQKVISL